MTIQRSTPQQYFGYNQAPVQMQQQQPAQYYTPNYIETVDRTVVIVSLIVLGVVAICGIVAISKK